MVVVVVALVTVLVFTGCAMAALVVSLTSGWWREQILQSRPSPWSRRPGRSAGTPHQTAEALDVLMGLPGHVCAFTRRSRRRTTSETRMAFRPCSGAGATATWTTSTLTMTCPGRSARTLPLPPPGLSGAKGEWERGLRGVQPPQSGATGLHPHGAHPPPGVTACVPRRGRLGSIPMEHTRPRVWPSAFPRRGRLGSIPMEHTRRRV